MAEDFEAYDLCQTITGRCTCLTASPSRKPCDAIALMIENGDTADDERDRIEDNAEDEDTECG